ncbi:hypothetical protein QQF64_008987 [Cirrhinus molitorella]|uniref:Endonuclease/exonuclease/phosphatase domain-containing protein n=1 Tax=Cirrhinus molitorella TaxID=172907 RepID=A0ABR3M962_9TELE
MDLPKELKRNSDQQRRHRRRGRRGGVLQRPRRWSNRPPLPSIILGNVRSLRTKMDELRVNARSCFEYRDSSLLVFTETWLHKDIPSSCVEIEGFSLIRADRGESSGKDRGGGVCVYVSNRWCTQYTVKETCCNPDVEYLCLSLRPFYLPREFGNILLCVVYIPPNDNASRAASSISDCIQNQLQRTLGAPVFIMGDFNECDGEASKGSWFHISDSSVHPVTEAKVQTSQAYLLFYEKIS